MLVNSAFIQIHVFDQAPAATPAAPAPATAVPTYAPAPAEMPIITRTVKTSRLMVKPRAKPHLTFSPAPLKNACNCNCGYFLTLSFSHTSAYLMMCDVSKALF